MGLEIGINDQVTISPYVRYNRFINNEWEGLQEAIGTLDNIGLDRGSNTSPINQVSAGIRLGISLER